MKSILNNWFESVNNVKTQEELIKVVEGFNLSDLVSQGLDELLNNVDGEYKLVHEDMFPYFLEALYISNDKDKFYLFCYLLELTYGELKFIPNLERHGLFEAKIKVLLPTLIKVARSCFNGISDCMYLILLNIIDYPGIKQYKNTIIKDITQKLETLLAYVKENELNKNSAIAIEILVDVAGYYNNDDVLKLVEETLQLENNDIRLFSVFSLLYNDFDVNVTYIEKIASDIEIASKFYKKLEDVNKTNLFPKEYNTQEYLAKSDMINWLKYPTELGNLPDEIEFIDKFEYKDSYNYLFKFKSSNEAFKDNGWMLGLSGGYEKNKIPTASSTGNTFSMFESLKEDYMSQGMVIIKLIEEQWKEVANQYS